jgi:hypothetical protein
VAYLKGGSAPVPCGDCPPAGGPYVLGTEKEMGPASILKQEDKKKDVKFEDKKAGKKGLRQKSEPIEIKRDK